MSKSKLEKWDAAYIKCLELQKSHDEAIRLYRELGKAIAAERALAQLDLTHDDVLHWVFGSEVVSGKFGGEKPSGPPPFTFSQLRLQYLFCKVAVILKKDNSFVWLKEPIAKNYC